MTRRITRSLTLSIVVVALAGALSAGCFRHQYGAPTPPPGPATYAQWNHQVLWGILAIDADVAPEAVCNGRPLHMSTYVGPLGMILGIITAGVYVPTTTAIWCGGGSAAAARGSGSPQAKR